MPRSLAPDQLRAVADRVSYYRDLGIYDFYRRETVETEAVMDEVETMGAPSFRSADGWVEGADIAKKPIDTVSALRIIREDIGDCTRCKLHAQGRKQIV